MTNQTNQLFVVALAVLPTATHPRHRDFPWACLKLWVLTGSADAALDRARELIGSADFNWKLATQNCLVNVATQWKGIIPAAARALTTPAQIVIQEEPAPQDSDLPNFEALFGADPLLTRQLNLNPQPCA